ncbi:MAG: sulfurtransferase [Acidobacteria bacterium]|nr:sulfurtransferase [Acidobacteriota bacterium]
MAKHHSPRFLTLVEEARKRVQELSVAELEQRLSSSHSLYLIDVREHEEWARGHIPQARHFCKGILERDIEAAIPDTSAEIILYCGGGYRSALAAENLQKMGYQNVASVWGGWRGWCEAGYPVAKD